MEHNERDLSPAAPGGYFGNHVTFYFHIYPPGFEVSRFISLQLQLRDILTET